MVKKALNHTLNTVCVNEEQVKVMLEVFEKLGMLPPERTPIVRHIWGTHKCQPENTWENER